MTMLGSSIKSAKADGLIAKSEVEDLLLAVARDGVTRDELAALSGLAEDVTGPFACTTEGETCMDPLVFASDRTERMLMNFIAWHQQQL
jgi:hypothetical protein